MDFLGHSTHPAPAHTNYCLVWLCGSSSAAGTLSIKANKGRRGRQGMAEDGSALEEISWVRRALDLAYELISPDPSQGGAGAEIGLH